MGVKSWIALGVAGLAAVAGVYWFSQHDSESPPLPAALLSTPPGITFQSVKVGSVVEVAGASSDQQALVTVYADADGHTLYTFDQEGQSGDKEGKPGKSACIGDCAKTWPPAIALADARPVDNWTVITRDDGVRQWAFKGKPLHTYVEDKRIGDEWPGCRRVLAHGIASTRRRVGPALWSGGSGGRRGGGAGVRRCAGHAALCL
jgi:predicted lipoprotein with Yx(FWY)xxD motif